MDELEEHSESEDFSDSDDSDDDSSEEEEEEDEVGEGEVMELGGYDLNNPSHGEEQHQPQYQQGLGQHGLGGDQNHTDEIATGDRNANLDIAHQGQVGHLKQADQMSAEEKVNFYSPNVQGAQNEITGETMEGNEEDTAGDGKEKGKYGEGVNELSGTGPETQDFDEDVNGNPDEVYDELAYDDLPTLSYKHLVATAKTMVSTFSHHELLLVMQFMLRAKAIAGKNVKGERIPWMVKPNIPDVPTGANMENGANVQFVMVNEFDATMTNAPPSLVLMNEVNAKNGKGKKGREANVDTDEDDKSPKKRGRPKKEKTRAEELKEASMLTFTPRDFAWEKGFWMLSQYKSDHGHANVPRAYHKNPTLANWVYKQKTLKEQDKLAQDRIDRLDELGIEWEIIRRGSGGRGKFPDDLAGKSADEVWEHRFQQLVAYNGEFGTCHVPVKYDAHPGLGPWVCRQRTLYNQGKLGEDRVQKLTDIGFEWKGKKSRDGSRGSRGSLGEGAEEYVSHHELWEIRFKELEEFKEKNGHCNIPSNDADNQTLVQWTSKQRMRKKRGALPKDREERLEGLGFDWGKEKVNRVPYRSDKAVGKRKKSQVKEENQDQDEEVGENIQPTSKKSRRTPSKAPSRAQRSPRTPATNEAKPTRRRPRKTEPVPDTAKSSVEVPSPSRRSGRTKRSA